MAKPRNLTTTIALRWRLSPVALYAAAFLFALQFALISIAIPWRIIAMGGEDLAVGAVGGLMLGAYMVSCLLLGPHADSLGVKRLVMSSTILTAVIVAVMPLASSVATLLSLAAAQGFVWGMLWSPLMGWLSAGNEGKRLNRRLGIFNLSWATGNIIGMWLGGSLYSVVHWLPFAGASLASLGACLLVTGVRTRRTAADRPPATANALPAAPKLKVFRHMSSIALIATWVAMGAIRIPFASLLNEMSLGIGVHAPISAGLCFILMCCFMLLGRSDRWHYRALPLLLVQLAAAAMLVGIALSHTVGALALFALAATPAMAMAYSSHQYYCVSGGRRRAASMAVHETLLSAGFVVGSFGGGVLGYLIGNRPMYCVFAAALTVAVAIQAALYIIHSRRRGHHAIPT